MANPGLYAAYQVRYRFGSRLMDGLLRAWMRDGYWAAVVGQGIETIKV
ncbi:MAG TPA: hypothetical protein VF531_05120 [Bacillota bacterium]